GAAAGTNSSTTGSSADRAGLRRFGVETIGSGQWFGDGPEPEVRGGTSPNRGRWSSREDERVTEQVSIDGEEHNLPPNVIGEGPH
ncbi:MAG TPA: hypothetical protein VGX25_27250, partial [Actinophytocola sp.]|uniref:hypothetical protein n=1 Tax=Actinophytocola sp. TaxID=1872138 RepID=UPI002DDD65A6